MSCPECFKGSIHDHSSTTGTESTIHGKRCYIASAPSTSSSNSTIIFLCDAFGIDFINNRILADKYAAQTGFRVVAPDVIPGGGMDTAVMGFMDGVFKPVSWWDALGQVKRIINGFCAAWHGVPFKLRASPAKSFPDILALLRAVKADMSSEAKPVGTQKGPAKLGVCGFCWGGKHSTKLCAETATPGGSERLIDAQFCAHPSYLNTPDEVVEAVSKFKVPYSFAAGEKDVVLSKKDIEATEAALRQEVGRGDGENGYHYEVVRYPDCGHGFAVRCAPDNKAEVRGAEDAREQAVNWFKRFL